MDRVLDFGNLSRPQDDVKEDLARLWKADVSEGLVASSAWDIYILPPPSSYTNSFALFSDQAAYETLLNRSRKLQGLGSFHIIIGFLLGAIYSYQITHYPTTMLRSVGVSTATRASLMSGFIQR